MKILKKLSHFLLFLIIFSSFFFPTLLYAQSTPWSFFNNSSQTNAMDIFYNGLGAANPAIRIGTNGNLSLTGSLSQQGSGVNFFTGNIGVGDSNPTSKFRVFDSKNTNSTYYSNYLQFESFNNSGSSYNASHYGLNIDASTNGGNGVTNLVGLAVNYATNWGNITNGYGVLSNPAIRTNSQLISNSYNFFANTPTNTVTGGIITNQYGLYVAAQKGTGVSNGYGVYQVGANDANYFGGNTQFAKQVGMGGYAPGGCGAFTLCVMGNALNGTGVWSVSDIRLKQHIKPIKEGLNQILQMQPVTFEYNREKYPDQQFPEGNQIGFIAQQIEPLAPELVSTFKIKGEDYKSLDYGHLTAILTQAIKDQQTEITDLKTTLLNQQEQIDQIKQQISALQNK